MKERRYIHRYTGRGKTTAVFALLLAASLLLAGCIAGEEEQQPDKNIAGLEKIAEFEGGVLYKAGNISVVQLNGDYHQMGRQYGSLLAPQIQGFYETAVVENTEDGLKPPLEETKAFARKNYELYPSRIKAVFEGMSETSGLSVDKLMLLDQNVMLSVLPYFSACSQIAVWGDYTEDGTLYFGKNEDFFEYFKEYDDTLAVVVYNPDDGSASVASICNAGQVSTMNAMNSGSLAFAMNQAPMLRAPDLSGDRMPLLISYMTSLLDSGNLEMMEAEFMSYRPPVSFIVDVADTTEARSYECSQDLCRVREDPAGGIMVATNHYADPAWALPDKYTASGDWKESEFRFSNLTALADGRKGELNAEGLMQILDTGADEGGATKPETIFQFVASPSEQKMWVKAPDYQDWVMVDVRELFT